MLSRKRVAELRRDSLWRIEQGRIKTGYECGGSPETVLALCDTVESLRAALDTLKKIINTDGSLDTFESHVDILRDAMHYLSIAGEYDTMHEEIRRLTKLLAEASRDR